MQQQYQHGDIVIELGQPGLSFGIVSEQPLTFATDQPAKKSWLRFMASALISIGLLSLPSLSRAATYTSSDIVTETNAARVAQGLPSLISNAALEQAATVKANDMFAKNYFGHYSPTGQAPWIFFQNVKYKFTAAGENLAIDYVDGRDIVPAWMSSKSHRDNLLNPAYQDIGIAVVDGTMAGSPTTLVVQFFGSRGVSGPIISTVIPKAIVPVPAVTVPAPQAPATVIAQPAPALKISSVPEILPVSQPTPAVIKTAEVQGLTTRVIPTLNLVPVQTTADPRITALILSTLGLYVTLLTMVGLIRSRQRNVKETAPPGFELIPT